jgi:hypothetical protein
MGCLLFVKAIDSGPLEKPLRVQAGSLLRYWAIKVLQMKGAEIGNEKDRSLNFDISTCLLHTIFNLNHPENQEGRQNRSKWVYVFIPGSMGFRLSYDFSFSQIGHG